MKQFFKSEFWEVGGIKYLVTVWIEKKNRITASFSKKGINIKMPYFLNNEKRLKELIKIKNLIEKKILKNPKKFEPKIQKEYKDGDVLKIGNIEYFLKLEFKNKQSSSVSIVDQIINLSISNNLSKENQNKHIATLLSKSIANQRLPELQNKIKELNQKHFNQKINQTTLSKILNCFKKREINKISFKHNKSNWGSCSSAGNINISTRLLFAPSEVLEYVCIHELAHLIEMNHSKNFWAIVKKIMPDYKEKIKWLKKNNNICEF
ncbi:MAG: M48 family metallopeptidase [Patescibacteria group bacterium]|nr:M48 family metallopeptidase [Patescibacteria group bacterium]